MKPDKRVEKSTKSVIALMDYLREIVQAPTDVVGNNALIDALRSQGALSKWEDAPKGICPSSINTLKRISESCILGGFDALDRLRTSALEAITSEQSRTARSNKTNKIGLTKSVNELEADKLQLLQDLARLSSAFQKSLKHGRNYAQQSKMQSVIVLCAREQRELLDELSLMHAVPKNVSPINRG